MKYHITLTDLLLKKELIVSILKENQKTIIYGNFYIDDKDKINIRELIKEQLKLREDLILVKSTIQKINLDAGKDKVIYELTELNQQLYANTKTLALSIKKSSYKSEKSVKELQAERKILEEKIENYKRTLTVFNENTNIDIELSSEISLPKPIQKLA